MKGLAYLSKPLHFMYSSLILLTSLDRMNGNEEDEFVATHDNSEKELIWPFARSSTSGARKQLCENLRQFAYPEDLEIVQGDLDHGHLLFKNTNYHSRSIDMIACLIHKLDNLEYFYCTQGRGYNSYYLLEKNQDKFFYLGKQVEVSIPEHVPGEILLRIREEQQRQIVQRPGMPPKRRRTRIEQPPERKPNYEDWPNRYHRTIWAVDL